MELTPKQEKFCRLVSEGKTYADAYRGSYSAKNMLNDTIYVKASTLMAQDKIKERVAALGAKTVERSGMTIDKLLIKMLHWVSFNPKDVINDDGTLKPLSEMSDDEASCIQDFVVEEIWGSSGKGNAKMQIGVVKKVKLIDKRGVADMFMKTFGAYLTKIKIEDRDGLDHLKGILGEIAE